MRSSLTIAGSDPTGGAGLQADIRVFRAFRVHGLSVVSALTAQNTESVVSTIPVDKGFFIGQMDVLLRDIKPDSLKTGMLFSAMLVDVIAERMEEYSLKNLVVDPVTISSTGIPLIEQETLETIKEQLFPLSRVITPNIYEASVLTGMNVEDVAGMEDAAKRLKDMGPEVVIITGGHLEGLALDLYYDGSDFHRIESVKIKGEYHGTGCAFSAAITAMLAIGHEPLESARRAKEFINNAIRKAYHLGHGMGLLDL